MTEIEMMIRQMARRVLENKANGRILDPRSVDWARGVLAAETKRPESPAVHTEVAQ